MTPPIVSIPAGIIGTTATFSLLQYTPHLAFICAAATIILTVPPAVKKLAQWAVKLAKLLD